MMAPFMPKDPPGLKRMDDRMIIFGFLHVRNKGCHRHDCPSVYGPSAMAKGHRELLEGVNSDQDEKLYVRPEQDRAVSLDRDAEARAHVAQNQSVQDMQVGLDRTLLCLSRGKSGHRVSLYVSQTVAAKK